MAETIKVLGQADLAATTLTDVYQVPMSTAAVLSSVVFCNRTSAAKTLRLSVAVAGAADVNKQYLSYDAPLDPYATVAVQLGITLGPTDVVRAYASATGVSVNVFGSEKA